MLGKISLVLMLFVRTNEVTDFGPLDMRCVIYPLGSVLVAPLCSLSRPPPPAPVYMVLDKRSTSTSAVLGVCAACSQRILCVWGSVYRSRISWSFNRKQLLSSRASLVAHLRRSRYADAVT